MKKKFISLALLAFVILSCNLPTQITLSAPATTTSTPSDLALTVTAQALLLSEMSNQTIQATYTPLAPSADTETPPSLTPTLTSISATPTFTLTPTPSTPIVSVSLDTNCRKGPGQAYDITGALLAGETTEVVGKNSDSNYWIITNPDNPTTTCWLWGEYASVSGNQSNLSEISIPPSPTPTKLSPPNAVSNLNGSGSCDNPGGTGYHLHTVSGTITWKDNANNEQGYTIYADYFGGDPPSILGSSGANATSYAFSALTIDNPFAILVESYNAAGTSKRVSVNIPYNCHP